MEDIETLDLLGTPLMEGYNLITMLLRFSFNMLVVWLMIHCLYYPKSGRRDYYFTFMLISISIFFLIFLLGGVKLKIGFALGLFAIFGIIRYRTDSTAGSDSLDELELSKSELEVRLDEAEKERDEIAEKQKTSNFL